MAIRRSFGDEEKKKTSTKKNKAGTTQINTKTRKTSLTGKDFNTEDYGGGSKGAAKAKSMAKAGSKRYGKTTTSCSMNKSKTKKSCVTYKNGVVTGRTITDLKTGKVRKLK